MIDPNKVGGMDAAVLVRRLLFFLLLFGLVFYYLTLNFNGLTAAHGMDQAQIGREIARGNGATTKVIRPAALWQAEKYEKTDINLAAFYDTYHSPLNPYIYGAVLKLVQGDDFEKYQLTEGNSTIYRLDRVISAVSVIFFLISVGITYLLISRIFDVRIAGVTALLMILCDLMWKFTQTGLPQMLMLMLFSCALFFIYQALEGNIENKHTFTSIIVAAVFLGLLALAHWLTIWITLGFVLYASFFLRPKGLIGLVTIGVLFLFSLFFMIKNLEWTGTPGGTAFLTLYGGLTDTEAALMRTSNPASETHRLASHLNSLLINLSSTILRQASLLYSNFGSIVVAPLFFFSLLHPFKREAIARFRWIILLMWIMGTLGMALFGLSKSPTDPNQLHILFAPVMSAYGLAFLSILWSRIELPSGSLLMKVGHFFIVVIISAGPLILTIPNSIRVLVAIKGRPKAVWPPYWPPVLSKTLHNATEENSVIFSDQPWAVAWYSDRISIWLPQRVDEFEDLEKMAEEQQLEPDGILVTPTSLDGDVIFKGTLGYREEFAAMMLDSPARFATKENSQTQEGSVFEMNPGDLALRDPGLSKVMANYPIANPLYPGRIMWFTKKPIISR